MYKTIGKKNIESHLEDFALLDDSDVFACVKAWMKSDDIILSTLCEMLVNRKLYKVIVQNDPIDPQIVNDLKEKVQKKYKLTGSEADYFVFSLPVTNDAYRPDKIRINILYKDGRIADIAQASDQAYLSGLKTVMKHFLCFPKEFTGK